MRIRPMSSVLLALIAVTLFGCGAEKKAEPAAVEALETYTDNMMNFSIAYPSNWQKAVEQGKQALFLSDNSVMQRFVSYDADGAGGAKIQISIKPVTGTLEEELNATKIFEPGAYSANEDATLGGQPAKKVSYSFELNDGKLQGERYVAAKDSTITIVEIEAFGSTFDALRPKFEEVLKSVQLGYKTAVPVIDTSAASVAPADTFKPSAQVRVFKGDGYSVELPDNFSSTPARSAGTISSTKFKGVGGPQDSFIQIDVLDASKQKDLNKIIDQNKKTYRVNDATQTTIGGQKAYYLNYSLVKDVSSRAYFVVKGDKLYRITMNWYKPEQALYLPAFEKAIGSFKL